MVGAVYPMLADHPVVFLDSNVVLDYLNGRFSWLFEEPFIGKFRYAINPIVFQEVVLRGADRRHPRRLERALKKTEMLPIDMKAADAILPRAKELRTRVRHSNDILIFSSAADCDYLITSDMSLRALSTRDKPRILTPEEFHREAEVRE
jgi:predicted nucleic acid-binding protein